jgi:hypothetical protein
MIDSLYIALAGNSYGTLRQAMIVVFDAVFFIFWFCAAIAVGHYSSLLTSNGVCEYEQEIRSYYGRYFNCGATISSAFFGNLVGGGESGDDPSSFMY